MSGPSDRRIETRGVDSNDPTLRGYHVTWTYALRYWQPLLGAVPFALWQALISFCYGERDFCWPSLNLLADLVAGGNRHLITGRYRGTGKQRRRQQGAIEVLEEHGLITTEAHGAGPTARYRFHVLKEPPPLTVSQLERLPSRLQRMHSDLLRRCGIDPDTYPQSCPQTFHNRGRHPATDTTPSVQGTTPPADGTTPPAQDTAKQYKRRREFQEIWRRIQRALSEKTTPGNYRTYIANTYAMEFDPDLAALTVVAPSPLIARELATTYHQYIIRELYDTGAAVDGVPIQDVDFVSAPDTPWPTLTGDEPTCQDTSEAPSSPATETSEDA
jgi:hypothetical protein